MISSPFVIITILCCANSMASAANLNSDSDQTLLQYMMTSKNLAGSDPRRSIECFNLYLPQIEACGGRFKEDFQRCEKTESDARLEVDERTESNRLEIEIVSGSVCEVFTACNTIRSGYDFFDCYSLSGEQNTKSVYNAAVKASDTAVHIHEQHALIQSTCWKCKNSTERVFREEQASLYKEMDICFKIGVPNVTPGVVTTPTTTTENPTTPEEEPSEIPLEPESPRKSLKSTAILDLVNKLASNQNSKKVTLN